MASQKKQAALILAKQFVQKIYTGQTSKA